MHISLDGVRVAAAAWIVSGYSGLDCVGLQWPGLCGATAAWIMWGHAQRPGLCGATAAWIMYMWGHVCCVGHYMMHSCHVSKGPVYLLSL